MGGPYDWFEDKKTKLAIEKDAPVGVHLRAMFQTDGIALAPGGGWNHLDWTLVTVGTTHDDILDLTDPANPTTKVAGWVTVNGAVLIHPEDLEDGKALVFLLELDSDGDDANLSATTPLDTALGQGDTQNICVPVTVRWFVPEGGVLNASVRHNKTDPTTTMRFYAYVTVEPA